MIGALNRVAAGELVNVMKGIPMTEESAGVDVFRLIQLRTRLAEALEN